MPAGSASAIARWTANAVLARAVFRQATAIGTDCRIGNGAFVSHNCRAGARRLIGTAPSSPGIAASARTPPSRRVRWRSTALWLIEPGRCAATLRANRSRAIPVDGRHFLDRRGASGSSRQAPHCGT
jgi:hypothetical protein